MRCFSPRIMVVSFETVVLNVHFLEPLQGRLLGQVCRKPCFIAQPVPQQMAQYGSVRLGASVEHVFMFNRGGSAEGLVAPLCKPLQSSRLRLENSPEAPLDLPLGDHLRQT